MYPRGDIDKVRERGETWAVDAELAETCRHIDEVGQSLRGETCALGGLLNLWVEKVNRRIDDQEARNDRIEGCLLRLEARVSILEHDRRPRQRRCHR
jgi:hypothetical protein